MKSRTMTCITAMTLLAALALPLQLAAQNARYKLIDLVPFGGPKSIVNGPGVRDLSNSGTYAGIAETNIPDPYAPFCGNPECLVQYGQRWRNGVVTVLGTLPGGNLSSGAAWISANGRFISGAANNGVFDPVTSALTELRAVVWTADGRIHNLGTLPGGTESFGASVNSKGQVVGQSNNTISDPFSMNGWGTQTRAVLWQNGVIQDIGTLGGPDALVLAINERSQIFGASYINSIPNSDNGPACPPNVPAQDTFVWENGTMHHIKSLGGTCSMPGRLNNRGQVVGVSFLADNRTEHPFFWDRGVLTDIGTLGGTNGEALDLSDSGLAVGTADLPGDLIHHAFVWKNGTRTDVGVVPGDLCTNGRAINSRGQAIGTSTDCMGHVEHMFLWENGNIQNLTAMILPGSGVDVVEAWDMNDRGEIAAIGLPPGCDNIDACSHAVLLIPASTEEIAAAEASGMSQQTHAAMHRFVKDADSSVPRRRNGALNMFRQTWLP